MESDKTSSRVLDALCTRYRESIRLVAVKVLPAPIYDFDPIGWDLLAVTLVSSSSTGPGEYVAVCRSTGEIRYLGHVGK